MSAESTDMSDFQGYEDLDGDPVYELLKGQVLEGGSMVGGKIETPDRFTHTGPRKLIHVAVYNHEDGVTAKYTFNYNQLKNQLAKENN